MSWHSPDPRFELAPLGRPGLTTVDDAVDQLTYTYNAMGQIETAKTLGGAGSTITYAYDPDGNRVGDATSLVAGVVGLNRNIYLPDGIQLTQHADVGGINLLTNTTVRHQTADGEPLGYEQGTQAVPTVSDLLGVTGALTPASFTWQGADNQNSVRYTNARGSGSPTGDAYTWHSYLPFGQAAAGLSAAPGAAAVVTTAVNGLLSNPPNAPPGNRGYLDKPIDATREIGLDHRNYQPNFSFLITPDPITQTLNPLGLDPYAYAGNNPIANSDPSGLNLQPLHDANGCTGHCGTVAPPAPDDCDARCRAVVEAYENPVGLPAGFSTMTPQQRAYLVQTGQVLYDPIDQPASGPDYSPERVAVGIAIGVTLASGFFDFGSSDALLPLEFGLDGLDAGMADAGIADAGATAAASLSELKTAADATIPLGVSRAAWGAEVWGTGPDAAGAARALIGRSADALAKIPSLTIETATAWRNFYEAVSAASRGAGTAPARVELMNDIIRTLGGAP